MNTYKIEITDTFGGEANYCWVRRYEVKAVSILGAVNKISREYGGGWRKSYGDNMSARYDHKTNCTCMLVDWEDGE